MSLTYIFGRSGSGKTTLILSKIAEAVKCPEISGIIYLVPEQFSLQAEKSLLNITESGASVKATVLSFARLAHQVYKQTGGISKTVLDDPGKSMLIRKIIYELSADLRFFNKIADKDGFIKSLSSAITELYHYEISPHVLFDCSKNLPNDYFTVKVNDIANIYSRYREYTDSSFMTSDNILSFLPEKIENSDYLSGISIFIDGFTGFTPQEYEVLKALLKKSAKLTIALTSLDNKMHYNSLDSHAPDPFYETKSTINKLSAIAQDVNVNIAPPIFLHGSYRFKNEDLNFLEQNYLSHKRTKKSETKSTLGSVSVTKTQNKYDEVDEAAKNILRLVRDNGYRFNDIAILSANVGDYSGIIKTTFDKYRTPVFIDERLDILSNPVTELIRSLMDIAVYNYTYEPMFRFLKTNITGISRPEYQQLENYVLAYGIDSYKWQSLKYWQNGFIESDADTVPKPYKGSFIREKILNTREKLIKIISPLADISSKKQRAVFFAKAVFEVLQNTSILGILEKSDESLEATQHKQVFNKICMLFDKFVNMLGETEITIKEFAKIIDAGLKSCDIGITPPSGDNVTVGDLERSRLPNIKTLLILGINDDVIPRLKEEDSIFSDAERENLLSHGIELSPDSRKLTSKEEFIVYNALTRPSEKLFLSYQTGGMGGKALRPSSVIFKIKSLFPMLKEAEAKFEYTLPLPMFNEAGSLLSNHVKGKKQSAEHSALLEWFSKSPEYGQRVTKMHEILTENILNEKLKEETIQNLYKNNIKTSASQLQKYSECPFAYFMRYNLNAKERKIYEAKAIDIGNIFHAIFDAFYILVQKEGLNWGSLTKEQISDFTEKVLNSPDVLDKADIMHGNEESKYRLSSIKAAAEKSLWALATHLKNGDFEPIASELKFGASEPLTAIRVAINDKYAFEITGTIDRVDITSHSGNTYVKILDYKSGSTKFDPTDIYYGRQMQLILYLKALTDTSHFGAKFGFAESKMLPGGIFYFNIKDPVISPEDSNSSDEALLKAFKLNGLVLKDKSIIGKMDERLPDQIKKSDIIPVDFKADGELTVSSEKSVRESKDFESICNFVLSKVASIGGDIIKGDITPKPYRGRGITACNYCEYSAVCGFGTTERLSRYNLASKVKRVEDIME